MKLFWASLTLQGPECVDPTFSRSRIKRRGQREKVGSSNRMPGFRIRAYSGVVSGDESSVKCEGLFLF